MRITKKRLAVIVFLSLGSIALLLAMGCSGEDKAGFYVEVEVEELIRTGELALVDVTVLSTNLEEIAGINVDEQGEAAVGERVTFATYQEAFTLYLKDASGEELGSLELPVGAYHKKVALEELSGEFSPAEREKQQNGG